MNQLDKYNDAVLRIEQLETQLAFSKARVADLETLLHQEEEEYEPSKEQVQRFTSFAKAITGIRNK